MNQVVAALAKLPPMLSDLLNAPQHVISTLRAYRHQIPASQLPWVEWAGLMALAITIRALFYTGFFGSDEVTYTSVAAAIATGDWSVSRYIGAIRYGVNLPTAAFIQFFGQNEFAAALWSMLCSLGEISLVVLLGTRLIGLRTAILAGFVLALLPLHVHYAGRMMADAPLALFITASFLLFWYGEKTGARTSLFMAGIAAGTVFWIKEATIFYLLVFLAYPLFFRRWSWHWLWMMLGFVLMIGGNLVFFWHLTGDPLYVAHILQSRVGSGYLSADSIFTSPVYYFKYLFLKIWHTWLMPYFALMALALWWSKRRNLNPEQQSGLRYLSWWGGGLIAVLSLYVVNWSPLTFIPKQVNYMLIFAAPLALLAGVALAALRGRVLVWVLAAYALPAVALATLEQISIQKFTANSRAVVEFARANPDALIHGSTNAVRAANFHNLVHPHQPKVAVLSIGQNLLDPMSSTSTPDLRRYAVIDEETIKWADKEAIRSLAQVPPCWRRFGTLAHPEDGNGIGVRLTMWASAIAPQTVMVHFPPKITGYLWPRPGHVYTVAPQDCAPSPVDVTAPSQGSNAHP